MNRTFIRKIYDRLMTLVFCLFALLLVAVIGAVAAFLIKNGAATLSWEFLSEPPKDGMLAGGIPVGIMTGLYFAEYAKGTWIVSLMRISIRSLAGVPSVIFGLFGLSLFVVFMQFGSCLLSAGLTLACLSLPLVVTVAEQAFLAVPQDYRDASYALGATKYQTIMKVVLPSAASTIITGAILAVGRVAGETAPIMFTGAAYFAPDIAKSLFSQVMALPYHIYVLATSATDPEAAAPIEYGAILVLIGLVMGTSAIGVVARARLSERNGR